MCGRTIWLDWIRYFSVRDPVHRVCGAVLRPGALQIRDLTLQQPWACLVRSETVVMTPTALGSTEPSAEFRFG